MPRIALPIAAAFLSFACGVATYKMIFAANSSPSTGELPDIRSETSMLSFGVERASPMISFHSMPGHPMRLLLGKSYAQSKTSEWLQTTLHVQNTSSKAIRAYEVTWESDKQRGTGRAGTTFEAQDEAALRAGEESSFVIESRNEALLKLKVNWVQFTDGTAWAAE